MSLIDRFSRANGRNSDTLFHDSINKTSRTSGRGLPRLFFIEEQARVTEVEPGKNWTRELSVSRGHRTAGEFFVSIGGNELSPGTNISEKLGVSFSTKVPPSPAKSIYGTSYQYRVPLHCLPNYCSPLKIGTIDERSLCPLLEQNL